MAATKPAFNPPGKKGDHNFQRAGKLAALIVLLMLGGIIVSLIISSWPSIQKFGLAFLWTKEWGCAERYLPGAGADLRYAGDLVYRAADRRPGEFWYRPVPDRACAWLAETPAGYRAIELLAAIQVSFTACGDCLSSPRCSPFISEEPVGNIMSNIPIVGALFSGPAFGIGILAAGVILAIMIIPYIAAVMRDVFEQTPVMMKESAYGIGCTTWKLSGVSFFRSPKMVLSAALCWGWGARSVKPWR